MPEPTNIPLPVHESEVDAEDCWLDEVLPTD